MSPRVGDVLRVYTVPCDGKTYHNTMYEFQHPALAVVINHTGPEGLIGVEWCVRAQIVQQHVGEAKGACNWWLNDGDAEIVDPDDVPDDLLVELARAALLDKPPECIFVSGYDK